MEPVCPKCKGTGVWETGNNDLPCQCPAGKKALFNVAGIDRPVTGEEIEKGLPVMRPRTMLVTVELTLEEAMDAIRSLQTTPVAALQGLDTRRSARDKLAAAVDTLVRDDSSGEALRHLAGLDQRTK